MMGNLFSRALSCIYKSPKEHLKDAELEILQRFTNTSCQSQFIPVSNNVEIRTLRFDLGFHKNVSPVVLLHGLLSGVGVWSPCFDLLAQNCIVYAIDLPGFGRSTRTRFIGNREEIEYQYVTYLEEWRDAVGLEFFILVGHGFSGYLATLYSMKYPERVKHLVLVEPWGFTELPFGITGRSAQSPCEEEIFNYEMQIPHCLKILNFLLNIISPPTILWFLPKKISMWIYHKYIQYISPAISSQKKYNNCINSYLYCCNSLPVTGQHAFLHLNLMYCWAILPLMHRLKQLDNTVPLSFIYGARSSVDHKTGYEAYHQRPWSIVDVFMVKNAGHQVFMDSPERFCDIILNIVDVESKKESRANMAFSGSSSEKGTEDLYWDCAWETINLSTATLNYVEGSIQHSLVEEWDEFQFEEENHGKPRQDKDLEDSDEDIFYAFE